MSARVRDVMTPGPIGVDYHQSIGAAARTMRDWGVGAVLVVSDQCLHGLVTDRDLVVRAVAESKGPEEPSPVPGTPRECATNDPRDGGSVADRASGA